MTRLQLASGCDRAMYFCFLPIAVLLPISTAVLEIFSGFIILFYLLKKIALGSSVKFTADPLSLAVLAFAFAMFLSAIASQFPYISWKGFLGKTLQSIFLFFAVKECISTRRRLNIVLVLFLLSAVVIAVDGIGQYFLKRELIFGHPLTFDGRITSSFSHANDLAAYLVIPAVLLAALMIWAWSARKERFSQSDLFTEGLVRFFVILCSLILTITTLGWTYSRGAWIGFAVSLVVLGFLDRYKWYIPFVMVVIFFSVFATQLGTIRNVSFLTDDISRDRRNVAKRLAVDNPQMQKTRLSRAEEEVVLGLSRFNGTGRGVFWSESFNVFKAAPIFGTGLNTYSTVARRYNKNWTGFYVHNCYLQMLAETGVLGLGSFFCVVFFLIRYSLRVLKNLPKGFYRSVLTGLVSGVIGFLVHSAMDTNFYSSRLGNLLWISMGLVLAVAQMALHSPSVHKK